MQDTLQRWRAINEHASVRRRAATPMIAPGDTVVIRDRHPGGKFCTLFEKDTWTVVRMQGTAVTARQRQNQIIRNVSFFKRAVAEPANESDDVDCDKGGSAVAS